MLFTRLRAIPSTTSVPQAPKKSAKLFLSFQFLVAQNGFLENIGYRCDGSPGVSWMHFLLRQKDPTVAPHLSQVRRVF